MPRSQAAQRDHLAVPHVRQPPQVLPRHLQVQTPPFLSPAALSSGVPRPSTPFVAPRRATAALLAVPCCSAGAPCCNAGGGIRGGARGRIGAGGRGAGRGSAGDGGGVARSEGEGPAGGGELVVVCVRRGFAEELRRRGARCAMGGGSEAGRGWVPSEGSAVLSECA